jgi:hypothetical protein
VTKKTLLIAATVLGGLVLLITSLGISQHRPALPRHPIPTRSTTTRSPVPRPDTLTALLPLSETDTLTAIRLASTFTTAYTTHRYTEPPQTYLARLQPITTPELYTTLAQAAATPGVRAQRTHDHEIATAHATPTKIRTLSADSLILLVDARQDITTSTGYHQRLDHLAVTAIKNTGGTWLIADIQPASAGDTGDTPNATTP